jgi:NitT/TauT family transport system permease protein
MDKRDLENLSTFVFPLLFLAAFIIGWQLVASYGNIDSLILPSPLEVVESFLENLGELMGNLFVTAIESVAGFVIGAGIAFALSITFVHYKIIKNSTLPFAIGLKATPLIALAPLVILWFGNEIFSKIIMGAMVAFFPVLINSVQGLAEVEKEQLNLLKSYSATKMQILVKLRIPNAMPFIFSSLKIASTLAVVGVVIGEFTGADKGLGFIIINASYYLNTPLMFAAIILISLWGISFYAVMVAFEKIVDRYYV